VLEVVDEERMRQDYWLGCALLFLHCFALGDRKDIWSVKKPVSLIPKGFLLEKVQEER